MDCIENNFPNPNENNKEDKLPYEALILNASKDGEVLTFTIQTKMNESERYEGGVIVLRQYEDFEYLSHCLSAHNDIMSTVVPVLPTKPILTPLGAETTIKKQLGKEFKTVAGDDFSRECRKLQNYLDLVIAEKALNEDKLLKAFLTEEKAPARANLRKGILASLKDALDDKRFHYHKDIDDELQNIRNFTDQCAFLTKSCHECFRNLDLAEKGYCFQLNNVVSAIRCLSATDTSENDLTTHLVKFAGFLDQAKRCVETANSIYDDTFGFTIDFYGSYLESAKEMLFRRTCKLVEFENAEKALEKAKQKNLQQLQTGKDEAERVYKEITEQTRDVIKTFHCKRIQVFRQALTALAQQQVQNSTKFCQFISQVKQELIDM